MHVAARSIVGGRADMLTFAVDDKLAGGATQPPAQRRRRRAPAQPQGEPDRHAARVDPGAARRLRQLRPRLSLQRRARRLRDAGVTPLTRADRRGVRLARAPLRSLGPRGRALAARPRQRDGLDRRRRHDRGRRSDHAPRHRARDARYELTNWLAADLDVPSRSSSSRRTPATAAASRSRRSRRGPGGLSARHALGPASRAAACASTASATARVRRRRARRARLHAVRPAPGYRLRWFDLALDIENLLDATSAPRSSPRSAACAPNRRSTQRYPRSSGVAARGAWRPQPTGGSEAVRTSRSLQPTLHRPRDRDRLFRLSVSRGSSGLAIVRVRARTARQIRPGKISPLLPVMTRSKRSA